jgi:glycosyltransferase involved in cell wall biosynthesis
MHPTPTVHILLATFNGALYLDDQLQSIARQTYSDWTLTVSDDGSSDTTLAIIQRFSAQVHQPVTVLQGPRQSSSTANFFHLVAQAPTGNSQDLYAFCDQDDVWYDDKLLRAVKWHVNYSGENVRLYCGRTQVVNEQLQPIGISPNISRPPSFGNALVQNIASGNSMVFSHAVLLAQRKVLPEHSVWHDWTTYIVSTALGGLVFFDQNPSLLYRQHQSNVIGTNNGLRSQLNRLQPLFLGRYKNWSELTERTVQDIKDALPQRSLDIFYKFQALRRNPSFLVRLRTYANSEVRRQSIISNASLIFAILFRLV